MAGATTGRRRLAAAMAVVTAAAALAACTDPGDGGTEVADPSASSCIDPSEYDLPDAVDEVTYITGFGDTAREQFVGVASELGIFEQLKIRVTVQPGSGLANGIAALTSGAAQFEAADAANLFTAYVNGSITQVQVLAAIQQVNPTAFQAFKDTGIERPRDLNGKRIGLVPGTAAEVFWPTYAALTPGLDASTVTVVPVSPQTQLQDLVAGRVDAVTFFAMAAPATEKAGAAAERGEVTILPWSDVLPDLYGAVLVATKDLIAENPGLVKRFTDGLLCGLEYMMDNPAEAAQVIATINPQLDDLAMTEAELTLMRDVVYAGLAPDQPVGYIDLTRAARGMDLLLEVGQITGDYSHALPTPGGPPDEGVINFGFVPGGEQAVGS